MQPRIDRRDRRPRGRANRLFFTMLHGGRRDLVFWHTLVPLFWGLLMVWPGFDAYNRSQSYSLIAPVWPESYMAIWMLALAALRIRLLVQNAGWQYRAAVFGLTSATWIVISTLFWFGNPGNTGTLVYGMLAASSAWATIRVIGLKGDL